MAIVSGTDNFMEGCFRLYSPYDIPFSQTQLLGTGTEDFYDSAYYFYKAPYFRIPYAGLTHHSYEGTTVKWSAFRLHTVDPITFRNGVKYTWRNGEATAKPDWQYKCVLETGGYPVGNPTQSTLTTYSWTYVWD
jgi:hypothetical protein